MTLHEIVVRIFKFIRDGGIGAVLGIAVFVLFFKPETKTVDRPVIVRDSAVIAEKNDYIRDLQEQIKAKDTKTISLVKRILALEKEVNPEITIGNTDPLEPIIVERVVNDTVIKYMLYPYDLVYYGQVTKDEIVLMTLNPYLENEGVDYVKRYRWDRLWDEFEFVVTTSTDITTASVKLYASRPFIDWRGAYGGLAYDFDKPYIWVDARFRLYSVEVKPKVQSNGWFGVEVGVRLD